MGRAFRSAAYNVFAAVVLAVAAAAVFASNLGPFAKTAVERYGLMIAGAPVEMEGIEFSGLSGKATVSGMTIGNPPGFLTDRALRLDRVVVEIDMATIVSEPVVVRRLTIDGLFVTYEAGIAGSNLDAIGRNIESYLAAVFGGGSPGSAVPGPRVVIRELVVSRAELGISTRMLHGATLTTEVADIRLTDIGAGAGATIGEVAEALVNAISRGVGRATAPHEAAGGA